MVFEARSASSECQHRWLLVTALILTYRVNLSTEDAKMGADWKRSEKSKFSGICTYKSTSVTKGLQFL
jgi:hypothetical protein